MIIDGENERENSGLQKSVPYPIVAIGAAAGGIEAITELLKHLSYTSGMAYVYIQHMETAFDSHTMPQLSSLTKMPVHLAKAGTTAEPNHIYILPTNKDLIIRNGVFVKDTNATIFAEMPINHFFTALADSQQELSIGILLSGGVADGVLGMKAIKLAGGLTYAQNDTAQFQTMSKAAASEGAADLLLSPKQLAGELDALGKKKEIYQKVINELNEGLIDDKDEDLKRLLNLLSRTTGVDFSLYKMNTIKRRIIRRMMLYKIISLKDYVDHTKQNASEINLLYQDLLINVTYFFRDEETAAYLKAELLPKIIASKTVKEPIRIWVPACATGQEVYSLAILINEALGENLQNIQIQLFATDLSEMAITKARTGLYSKDEIIGVSSARLQRFFTKIDGHYRVIKPLRDICIFAQHNIIKDPPFSRIDLISCCNLFIYLDNPLQRKILATFHHSLNSIGYLILGKSETIGLSANLFFLSDKKTKIYTKKREAVPQLHFDLYHRPSEETKVQGKLKQITERKLKNEEAELDKVVDTLLLNKFVPASVVVNFDLDILLFRGSTGLYLEPAPGKASLNLMKMAKSGLGFELKNIVHKAKKAGKPQKKEGLDIASADKAQRVTIQAIPLKTDREEEYFLVVFEEYMVPNKDDGEYGTLKDKRVKQLEEELLALREDMRSIVEMQEAANEELQSANEEIVSSNEELQSINEELETSKEEIESSNEELITINQELQIRNYQLAEAQEYSIAVFTFMRHALLILDKDLRVKTANQAFYRTFNMQEETTEGRFIYDLGNKKWDIPNFREHLQKLLLNNIEFTDFEVTNTFPEVGEKTLLLNARKIAQRMHEQYLVLIAIEDITEQRKGEQIVLEREAWFRNMADNSPIMIWVTGTNRLCNFVNKTYLEYRGITLEEAINNDWTEGALEEDKVRCEKVYNQSFVQKTPFELTYHLRNKDGEHKLVLTKAKPNFTIEGTFLGFIGSCVAIDEHLKKELKTEL